MGANVYYNTHPKYSPDGILYSIETAHGTLMDEAFYDHGHNGYSGTIAEKPDFKVFTLKEEYRQIPTAKFESIIDFDHADDFFEEPGAGSVYDDKWGPGVVFETKDSYVFTGYASA